MDDLVRLLRDQDHVFRRAQATAAGVTPDEFARRLRRRDWQRVFPRTYVAGRDTTAVGDSHDIRLRAAVLYAGSGSALSHVTAAASWGLPVPASAVIHVAVPRQRFAPHQPGLYVHRLQLPADALRMRLGLPLVCRELALVQAYGMLDQDARHELVLTSVRERLVAPALLRAQVGCRARHRRELLDLLTLAAGGSHSPLEVRLLLDVVRRHRLPEPVRQHRVDTAAGTATLDMAWPGPQVAAEADGKAWHFDPVTRAADLRRDAALAARGWVVLRFTHDQVMGEPAWVAGQIRGTLQARSHAA